MIKGNYIGTNAAGTAALNASGTGIEMRNTSNNLVGGTTTADRNLISGNFTGLSIINSSATTVQGNYIGTNPAGTAALANSRGIVIDGGANNTIGGTVAGARNVISGGLEQGIILAATSGNIVQGNFIGTNAAGTAAIGNENGIAFGGISNSSNNLIGGTTSAARNLISANRSHGIFLNGTNNTVQGNCIGTDVNGAADLGNGKTTGLHGIELGGNGNIIGGIGAGEGNIIAFNGCTGCFGTNAGSGIRVSFAGANRVRGNAIFGNVELGIDLVGGSEGANRVTPNDNCDGDSGPNNLQNFPLLTSASSNGINTTINGTLNSTASTTFQIDFYTSSSCDPSGNGEGQAYLGSTTVNSDGTCGANIQAVLPVPVSAGSAVTATATDPTGNTSEFSACVIVPVAPDSDGDGMPDEFEQFYFGSPTAGNPAADDDGDGATNLEEYRAGTNPTNAASVLRIVATIKATGGGFTFTFRVSPERNTAPTTATHSTPAAPGRCCKPTCPVPAETSPSPTTAPPLHHASIAWCSYLKMQSVSRARR